MELKPGDIFGTANPMWLGRAINCVQKINSTDNHSEYSHSGIILDEAGATFESLWTIRKSHINNYIGKKVLIGRNVKITPASHAIGIAGVFKHEGQLYPFWRLPLHLVRPLAKYLSVGKFPVCSELVGKYLYKQGLLSTWKGRNPDDIADMIHQWKEWEIVFEGVFEGV